MSSSIPGIIAHHSACNSGLLLQYTDSYGNEVTQLARPLPIEYLLVDVPVSTPVEPLYTFCGAPGRKRFPVENRLLEGHIQDLAAVGTHLAQFSDAGPQGALEAFSDFHLLLYLASLDIVPLKVCKGDCLCRRESL